MPERSENQPLLIERIERALVLLAYFIHLDGDAHVAMYEKFEAELDELRRRESTKERARHAGLLQPFRAGKGDRLQEFELELQRWSFAD
jgi:hypothetical protein